ncbi:signal peptide peptidase-like 2B [Stegodyphus dumicola]|uniref:signal peptide peptidase-like 2B n=1 Tax=Stegodyphus dumicola TaxID=202533 RepID=UPI0015B0426C|nr:signal peptide peptidase-like 2B [Stegodyphus dumicola]
MAISICWVVIRKQKYAWILQDILGVAFCINMLKSIRLPSLKICTVLLVLLFFYDIFFVFITPFLTMKGQSIMEEVATGGKSEEMLPMVLRVDYFGFDPLAVCFRQYSLLGFGDILVPGLLISYCHGYDLITNKKLYFPVTIVAYGVGLLVTFIGLFLMSAAQPALLYLVPSTLLPPTIIGWCRHELSTLWTGFKVIRPEVTQCPDVQVTADNPQYEAADEPPILPTIDSTVSKNSANIPDVTGEKKYLLQQ